MNIHTMERIYKIEEMKKLKPIKQKKEYNLKVDTISKDPNLLRRIMMQNYPILTDCFKKIPEYEKESARITKDFLYELLFALENDLNEIPNITAKTRQTNDEERIVEETQLKKEQILKFNHKQKALKIIADE